jgi:hypothetical protein
LKDFRSTDTVEANHTRHIFSSDRIGYVVSPTGAGSPAYAEDQIGDTKTENYALYSQGGRCQTKCTAR